MTKKLLALTSGIVGTLPITVPAENAVSLLKIKSDLTSDCLAASGSDHLAQLSCSGSEFSSLDGTSIRFDWAASPPAPAR